MVRTMRSPATLPTRAKSAFRVPARDLTKASRNSRPVTEETDLARLKRTCSLRLRSVTSRTEKRMPRGSPPES